jgi:hypothetical protein
MDEFIESGAAGDLGVSGDATQEKGRATYAIGPIGRALGATALEASVALAIIVVGIVVGGLPGQLLTGLGGVLISYSTTLSIVEERARERQIVRERELRGRELDRLRGFYRQIYNTHLQILNATTEPEDGLTSFALITQSNRNLFFLLTEIEAIVGELDIRVASLTNRMRANMQEMEILRDKTSDDESAQRLAELEEEQIGLKHQLAAVTSGSSASAPVLRRQSYVYALVSLSAPQRDASSAEWVAFLRSAIELLGASPELAREARAAALPLTMIGDVLREKNGGALPGFSGIFKGLSVLFQHALAGTAYCVVSGAESYRGVAFRDRIPPGLHALPDISVVPRLANAASAKSEGELGNLPKPEPTWSLDDWVDYLRTAVPLMVDGGGPIPLPTVGKTLKQLSEAKMPTVSGLTKLAPFLQLALTGTEYCVIEGDGSGLAVGRRDSGVPEKRRPDMTLVGGKARILDAGPQYHTRPEYQRLLRESVPPLNLPQPELLAVLERLVSERHEDSSREDFTAEVASVLPQELASKASSILALLANTGLLEDDGEGALSFVHDETPAELLAQIEELVTSIVYERLGEVRAEIVHDLVSGEDAPGGKL